MIEPIMNILPIISITVDKNSRDEDGYLYRVATEASSDLLTFGAQSRVIRVDRYKIIRHTPKGCWIDCLGSKKWVSNTARKRFAHKTKREALHSLKYRKAAHIRFLKRDLESAMSAFKACIDEIDRCGYKRD